MLALLPKISYTCVIDKRDSKMVPAEGERSVRPDGLKLGNDRFTRIGALLNFEKWLNDELQKCKVADKVTYVFAHFQKVHVEAQQQEVRDKIAFLIQEAKKRLVIYKENNKAALFKKDCAISQLFVFLDAKQVEEKQSPGMRCEEIAQKMLSLASQMRDNVFSAVKKNKDAMKDDVISNSWKCAKILEKLAMAFLKVPLFEIHEENDNALHAVLIDHERLLKLPAVKNEVALEVRFG